MGICSANIFYMLHKLLQVTLLLTTIATFQTISVNMRHAMGHQGGHAGELLVALLAGVVDDVAVKVRDVFEHH